MATTIKDFTAFQRRAENANSRAEMAIENQQELTGARLLQDGLVYVSRHRTYYAAKAFEEVRPSFYDNQHLHYQN